jgi:alkanesulfonate monooxygenase SsuD/methylene tetrahydromethanopterin reductase-like flavin-dependent oxidoreductase (luciferase family)
MPKIILQVYPSLGDTEEMKRRRPIGRDNEAYQNMLEGLVELVRAADDLGYWGITHVEHHAHSEGLEISPAPLMLNIYLGHYTKRLRHGQLGVVLPAHDPVRLAEEIAITDHMLQGRFFVGMARGYQARWQNVLGQRFNVTSTASDQSAADQRNRLLFNENYKIMKMAWENDLLRYKGPTYEIPFPYEEGIPNWPPSDTTTRPYGVPGEVDENGTVRGISVVPGPYTRPHPQLFQAFGASPGTLRWCGEENVTPTILAGPMENVRNLIQVYQEGAASRGREVPFGKGIGLCRTFHIVKDRADLYRAVEKYEAPVWLGWYQPFGFMESARLPGEEGPVPKPGEHLADRLIKSGLLIGGTLDEVKRQTEALLEQAPVEYLVWLFHWGLIPRDEGLEQLELMATKVFPEFGMEWTGPAGATAGAGQG